MDCTTASSEYRVLSHNEEILRTAEPIIPNGSPVDCILLLLLLLLLLLFYHLYTGYLKFYDSNKPIFRVLTIAAILWLQYILWYM
jgi:hypothetical protein